MESLERSKAVRSNISYSVVIRIVSMLTTYLLIPLTIDYVNSELYGIWLTLSSMITCFMFLDLGFGLGLRNRLTNAISIGDLQLGKILVSTTYVFLFILFLVLGTALFFLVPYFNWVEILNIDARYTSDVCISIQITLIAFCCTMAIQLIQNVCQSYQYTALANSLNMAQNVLCVLCIIVLKHTVDPSLPLLSIVMGFSPVLVMLIASIILYSGKFKEVSPKISHFRKDKIIDVAGIGMNFFLISIVNTVLYLSLNFIISHYCGPDQVSVFNVAYKYVASALIIFNIVHSSIWSAFNDAYAQHDYNWMKKMYGSSMKMLLLTELAIFTLVILSPWAYHLWIGDSISIPFRVTLILGIYNAALSFNNFHALVLNGTGIIRFQTILSVVECVIYVPLVMYMGRRFGLNGILIALTSVTLLLSPFLFIQAKKVVSNDVKGFFAS